jgi:hypothetical protein
MDDSAAKAKQWDDENCGCLKRTTEARNRAEKIYQGWCEIDTPRERIHERIVNDIAAALSAERKAGADACKRIDDQELDIAEREGYRRGLWECQEIVFQYLRETCSKGRVSEMIKELAARIRSKVGEGV